jgi:S-adenosylmethionine:tRNA ribosyltransferase-isomerase
LRTELFDYELPESLIASHPPKYRDGGRLLVIDPRNDDNAHRAIRDLPEVLPKDALLVANNTRVIPARLFGARPTGGKVEVLLVRPADSADPARCRFEALVQANRPLREGDRVDLHGVDVTVVSKGHRGEALIEAAVSTERFHEHVRAHGQVPLPPYIRRQPVPEDGERYQTVYAEQDGSVAAPTAGLHFTPGLMADIAARGVEVCFVTLHVGPGTFRPITADDVSDHEMDREEYFLSETTVSAIERAKAEGRPVVAVGTTTVRALEGAYAEQGALCPGHGFTRLFITPGFKFNVIDGLLTNFHLPRSTLLLLVSALVSRERILSAYREAVAMGYRFYSYGDAMLILPRTP